MPRYIGYEFTGTANSTVVTPALNGGITDKKYNSGVWSINGIDESSVYDRRRGGNWLTSTRGQPLPVELVIVLHGAQGGTGAGPAGGFAGGSGGITTMTVEIPQGTTLYIKKGGQGTPAATAGPNPPGVPVSMTSAAEGGTNGGGNGGGSAPLYGGGGGGGYSGIFINSVSWSNALAIAGGGGGGGGQNADPLNAGPWPGGAGGGTTGANATGGAQGGSQSSVGSVSGTGGGQLQGKNAADFAGGGGGGYYGGGAGDYQPGGNYHGGAGGSGFVATTGTINSVPITVTASSTSQGGGTSTGLVTINGVPYSDDSTYTIP